MSDTRVKKFDKLLGEQVVGCTTSLPPVLARTLQCCCCHLGNALEYPGLIWGYS